MSAEHHHSDEPGGPPLAVDSGATATTEESADARVPPAAPDLSRTAAVVRAEGIQYGYGVDLPVLRGVDLEIGMGEIVAVIGPRGAGKSTLLRILAGELEPTSGTVDLPARRSSAGRGMVGYAGREGAHFESLSGWQNALFFARVGGMRRRDAEPAVARLMDTLALDSQARAPVSRYSQEARQRLLIVEALAHRPALMLLDDPFRGLDSSTKEALINELRLRSAQRGTVVVASESLSLIPELADRLLFMHEGRIAARGRVAELLSSVGSATRLEVVLERRPPQLLPRFDAGIEVVSEGDPYVVELASGRPAVGKVLAALVAAGATVGSATIREADLGEAFRRATGAELPR